MLKGTFLRQYKHAVSLNMVFVYAVTGSAQALEEYEVAQGDRLVIDSDTGKHLFFTIDAADEHIALMITRKGNVAVDTSKFDRLAAKVKAAGGDLGQEIAKIAAAEIMGIAPAVAVAAPAPVAAEPRVESPAEEHTGE